MKTFSVAVWSPIEVSDERRISLRSQLKNQGSSIRLPRSSNSVQNSILSEFEEGPQMHVIHQRFPYSFSFSFTDKEKVLNSATCWSKISLFHAISNPPTIVIDGMIVQFLLWLPQKDERFLIEILFFGFLDQYYFWSDFAENVFDRGFFLWLPNFLHFMILSSLDDGLRISVACYLSESVSLPFSGFSVSLLKKRLAVVSFIIFNRL